LLVDAAEEVRNAAEHARDRLAEQASLVASYEAAVRERVSRGARTPTRPHRPHQ
jgi:hypothetical protein